MDRSSTIQAESKRLIQMMQLPDSFVSIVNNIYLPLAEIIINRTQTEPLFISINGAQGTGKSTLTEFLKHLIEAESGLSVAGISLDDYYLTRAERTQLAKDVHPLFTTRGVPGTHDLSLMTNTISALREKKSCIIPRFDKTMDDRCHEDHWTQYNSQSSKPVNIILFEGWCNHSPQQSDEELIKPINELEELEDPSGIWRNYANDQLKNYQQKIFNYADMSIMLKAPDFNCIYEWRSLQEKKLMESTSNTKNLKIMSPDELKRFIQHYERISRHTLEHLPKTADVVIPISNEHSINEILIKQSS